MDLCVFCFFFFPPAVCKLTRELALFFFSNDVRVSYGGGKLVIPSCYIEFSCLMVFNYLNMGIQGKCILWLGIRCIYALLCIYHLWVRRRVSAWYTETLVSKAMPSHTSQWPGSSGKKAVHLPCWVLESFNLSSSLGSIWMDQFSYNLVLFFLMSWFFRYRLIFWALVFIIL